MLGWFYGANHSDKLLFLNIEKFLCWVLNKSKNICKKKKLTIFYLIHTCAGLFHIIRKKTKRVNSCVYCQEIKSFFFLFILNILLLFFILINNLFSNRSVCSLISK
ncbi:hypothetical protein C2G38_2106731 [Gigaspora rosea]|uniref:Uncharacterized protein n=1 Tax=Gigaspora rosea TaxID=44941 RepID=A0A397USM7_9GLOM|nr:hypothetical protein C2G38_2106731 [Gigaspora rosea]